MIDSILIFSFFLFLLFESVKKKDNSYNINSYAIGNRVFGTYALTSTIVATWISGSGLILDLVEFKKDGLIYFVESIGMCLNLALFGWLIIPRMQGFLGKTSIASYMQETYGDVIGNITALLGAITSLGGIAIQFKIMGTTLNYFFTGGNEYYLNPLIIVSSAVVVFYTYAGGIRGVVRTDIIQTVCFSLSLIIAIAVLCTRLEYLPSYTQSLPANLHPSYFLQLNLSQIIDFILVTGYFLIPGLKPDVIQRVSMAPNIKVAQKSYYYGSIGLFIILCLSCLLSYLLFSINSDINENNVIDLLLDIYHLPLTKGVLIIGIISMCMSTADSKLNISSVLLVNDTFFYKKKNPLEKLFIARNCTIVIGSISILFALKKGSLFSIILFVASFYLPIISVPVLLSIFGFKTTRRCCLFTIIVCSVFVLICNFLVKVSFDINFIGMILNLILMLSSHYVVEKWEWFKRFGVTSKLHEIKKTA